MPLRVFGLSVSFKFLHRAIMLIVMFICFDGVFGFFFDIDNQRGDATTLMVKVFGAALVFALYFFIIRQMDKWWQEVGDVSFSKSGGWRKVTSSDAEAMSKKIWVFAAFYLSVFAPCLVFAFLLSGFGPIMTKITIALIVGLVGAAFVTITARVVYLSGL